MTFPGKPSPSAEPQEPKGWRVNGREQGIRKGEKSTPLEILAAAGERRLYLQPGEWGGQRNVLGGAGDRLCHGTVLVTAAGRCWQRLSRCRGGWQSQGAARSSS